MATQKPLQRFFKENRAKYHSRSLRDICLSGRLRFHDQGPMLELMEAPSKALLVLTPTSRKTHLKI